MTPARRRAVVAAAAVGAAAGGLSAAWWRHRRPASDSGAAALPEEIWSLRFPQPGGGEVTLATMRGRPLLINFWATWCPPCVREMPVIDRFARQFAANGWQVLGVAADQERLVRDFLDRSPVSYSIALAGFEGITLSRHLGNDSGALPFTVAIDAQGRIAWRHLGETSFEQLVAWVENRPHP